MLTGAHMCLRCNSNGLYIYSNNNGLLRAIFRTHLHICGVLLNFTFAYDNNFQRLHVWLDVSAMTEANHACSN